MTGLSSTELTNLLRILSLNEILEKIDEEFNKTFVKSEHFRVGCVICLLIQDKMLTKPQVDSCWYFASPWRNIQSVSDYSCAHHCRCSSVSCLSLHERLRCVKSFSIELLIISTSDSHFLNTSLQRISAFSILCDLYRYEQSGVNPFMLFFLDSVEQGTDLCEKRFLVELLCSAPSNREVIAKTSILDRYKNTVIHSWFSLLIPNGSKLLLNNFNKWYFTFTSLYSPHSWHLER